MEDYRLSQTGQEVQDILNGAAMKVDLNTEVERATDAEGTLQANIDAEAQARQDADGVLQQGIDDEAQRAKDAEEANAGEIEGIKALIPSTASDANKLADTNYVNSSIQTATAEYRGDYNVVTDLHLAIDATHAQIETLLPTVIAEADKNDYCYVMIPTNASTPTEIAKIERYKMTSEGWKFEYDVNNSTFTAEEWAAIKSGITSGLVAKLNALPTNADLLLLLAGKQDVLTFDSVPVPESNNPVKSGGVYSAIDDEKTARLNSDTAIHAELDGLQAKVPATASSDNKLVDQNQMNTSISTATATFRGDWNVVSDLHLAVDATRAQIAALLPTVISTADNNDYCYVEIPTNADTPTQIERVERYKFNGTAWAYEYTLNNSGFTAAQWAAINSMITSGLVAKLSALPTNADLLAMLAQKQDNLTFDTTPTENSTNPVTSGGVFAADKALSDAIEAILLLIPSAASALNKLVDTSLMNSSISTATATFRGTYNLVSGLGLGIDATEGEIAAALSTTISTADNNDYSFVQIPTSAETPTQIARTDRYKYNGTAWAFEYTLNTSGFTAAQWAAINSGVTDTLVAELANIANLIPSEASQYNKLADKVYVITQIIAHIADFKGEYGTLLELQSVLNPKPGDLGIVRTKDNDGKDVYTFYQYKDSLWNEYYTLSYHPQIKPATTGTTGDYPYNGMGRVELPMNMANDVNTLTQDMFYKGTVGFREPNTNTIFVIRYDFTLGEDITVPNNCILEFDGGSISAGSGQNMDTITGQNTGINAGLVKIFNTDVTLSGTWNVLEAYPEWISCFPGSQLVKLNSITEKLFVLSKNIILNNGEYYSNGMILLGTNQSLSGKINSKIVYIEETSDIYNPMIKILGDCAKVANIELDGNTVFADSQITEQHATVGIWAGFYNTSVSNKNIVIENCYIHNCSIYGIIMVSSDSRISNCEIYNNGLGTIANMETGGISIGYRQEIISYTIENDTVKDSTVHNNGTYCIFIKSTEKCLIKNNKISNGKYIGVGSHLNVNIEVNDNIVEKTKDNGIDIQQCNHSIIRNNKVLSCGNKPKVSSGSDVCAGIFVGDDNNSAKSFNNRIIDNTIIGNPNYIGSSIESDDYTSGYGVFVHNEINCEIKGNYIKGIADLSNLQNESVGIYTTNTGNCEISDNQLYNVNGYAIDCSIQFSNGSVIPYDFVYIEKNIVEKSKGIKFTRYNRGCTIAKINDNTVITSGLAGITCNWDGNNFIDRLTEIKNNNLQSNNYGDVFISLSSTTSIYLQGAIVIDNNIAYYFNDVATISMNSNLHINDNSVFTRGIGSNYLFGISATKVIKNPLNAEVSSIGAYNDAALGSIEVKSGTPCIKMESGWKDLVTTT